MWMSFLISSAFPSFPFCSLCSDPAAQNNPNDKWFQRKTSPNIRFLSSLSAHEFSQFPLQLMPLCCLQKSVLSIHSMNHGIIFFLSFWGGPWDCPLWRVSALAPVLWEGCTCVRMKPVWVFYSKRFNSKNNLMAEVKRRTEPSPPGRHVTTRALSVRWATLKPTPNIRTPGLSFSTSCPLWRVLAENHT